MQDADAERPWILPDKIPEEKREGGHEIPELAEELWAFAICLGKYL